MSFDVALIWTVGIVWVALCISMAALARREARPEKWVRGEGMVPLAGWELVRFWMIALLIIIFAPILYIWIGIAEAWEIP